MLYQIKRSHFLLLIGALLFFPFSNFAQQPENQLTKTQEKIQLTFINGIDDCPFYGLEGTFITELLTHFQGEKIKVNKEQHSLVLEFNNWDNSLVINNELIEYAKKNHYPESHMFKLKNLVE